jgi:hypothetical protein
MNVPRERYSLIEYIFEAQDVTVGPMHIKSNIYACLFIFES